MPSPPLKFAATEEPSHTSDSAETVIAVANNIALKKEENKEEYSYDINTHSYIKHYMYWQKYGMPAYDLLMKQYKKNKK